MKLVLAALGCAAAIALGTGRASAIDGGPRMRVPVVESGPSIDGDTGWEHAAHLTIGWDFTHGRAADEPSDVAVVAAGTSLYVRFTVHQRAPLTATQTVDNSRENSDDDVTVRLWPGGTTGLAYDFRANPHGTHYQASSENANYAPAWTSLGTATPDGYVVTMRIPLRALRSDGRGSWNAQFERDIRAANERDVWSHGAGQSSSDQVAYAGQLDGFGSLARSARATPRVGIYGLAEAGTPATGGRTSRAGADIAIPVTATTSLVATIHPDFSNVETDQQTIAPTTFARFYNEVRPFFAQGSRYYDNASCYGCAGWAEFYTPSIPTPKRGYQLEGKQGPLTFGVLDAVGESRNDNAQSLGWQDGHNHLSLNYTRVGAEQRLLHDVTNFVSLQYSSQHGVQGYLETGAERGTNVTDVRRARRFDGGIAYATKDDFDAFTIRSVGSQWNPVDGFTSVNDVAGYSAQINKTAHPKGPIESMSGLLYIDKYAGSDGFGTNLFDTEAQATVAFTNKLRFQTNVGAGFYRVPGDPVLHPANTQNVRFDYRVNTPVQSTLNFAAGRFGDGWLIAIDRLAGFRIAHRATVSLEAYNTTYNGPTRNVQWLERGSVNLDVDRFTAVTVGMRKVIGTAPPFPGQAVPAFQYGTNVSFAIARRRARDDFYLVYGDASAFATRPAVTLKYIKYLGADKGT